MIMEVKSGKITTTRSLRSGELLWTQRGNFWTILVIPSRQFIECDFHSALFIWSDEIKEHYRWFTTWNSTANLSLRICFFSGYQHNNKVNQIIFRRHSICEKTWNIIHVRVNKWRVFKSVLMQVSRAAPEAEGRDSARHKVKGLQCQGLPGDWYLDKNVTTHIHVEYNESCIYYNRVLEGIMRHRVWI